MADRPTAAFSCEAANLAVLRLLQRLVRLKKRGKSNAFFASVPRSTSLNIIFQLRHFIPNRSLPT